MSGGGWAGVDELLPTLSVYNRDFDRFDTTWRSYDWGCGQSAGGGYCHILRLRAAPQVLHAWRTSFLGYGKRTEFGLLSDI